VSWCASTKSLATEEATMHARHGSTPRRHAPIHFYVPDSQVIPTLLVWDPDSQPQMFASGVGHNLYELYIRFRDAGLPVSLGGRIPGDARAVIAFTNSGGPLEELKFGWRAARYRTLIIRSDAALAWDPLLDADLMVIPNESQVWIDRYGSRGRYLPALPQRGLIPRTAQRSTITTLVFKGNPENVPSYFTEDADFLSSLSALGVELVIDSPTRTNGSDQMWHDFSQVDISLCLRRSQSGESLDRKPPTRLINSWCAGTVPFVAREPAYLALLRDGENGFMVESPAQVLSAVRSLCSDPGLAEKVWAGVRSMQARLSSGVILGQWMSTVDGLEREPPTRVEVLRRRAVIVARATRQLTRVLRRRARLTRASVNAGWERSSSGLSGQHEAPGSVR
jgi:hypothetical protein